VAADLAAGAGGTKQQVDEGIPMIPRLAKGWISIFRGLNDLPGVIAAAAVAAVLAAMVLIPCGCGRKPDARPNIVLVVLDTVRDDYAGAVDSTGSDARYTPYLDQLAATGTLFAHAWSNAPWTVPSHASLFTGLLPSEHGCTSLHPKLDAPCPTLAELLAAAGYQTAGFYSNPWLSDRASELLRGFEARRETPLTGFFTGDHRYPDGDQGGRGSTAQISQWLGQRRPDQPFFLFVNYLESHLPYDPPADYRRAFTPDIPRDEWVSVGWGHEFNAGLHPAPSAGWERKARLYGGDVNTADRLLGSLVSILKREGLYENSILIVTSDHGENLGEHGLAEHQFSVHETLLAVPLVIRAPGRVAPGVREDPVMLLDLFATVLDLAGVTLDGMPALSRSLVAAPDSATVAALAARPLPAEYAGPPAGLLDLLRSLNPGCDTAALAGGLRTLRVANLRLTVGEAGRVQLHDLREDPGQTVDLAPQRPQQVAILQEVLARFAPGDRGPQEPVELDETTRRQLRSLGYVR
jgi:arylsulfatase A-like enzyme